MKVVSISDTHIEKTGDDREVVLHQFLSSSKVLESDIVILNGDIFDYMTGYHLEYQRRFSRFFKDIANLINHKVKVVFIEGNHDLHVKKNFDYIIKNENLDPSFFVYSRNEFVIDDGNRKLLFTHGDEIPGSSPEYIRYKKIIRSFPLRIIAHLMPLWLFDYLAIKASKNSRRKSSKYSEDESMEFFRENSMKLSEQADIIVLGHSHIVDEYSEGNSQYFNNGFAPSSRKYFSYSTESGPSLESV